MYYSITHYHTYLLGDLYSVQNHRKTIQFSFGSSQSLTSQPIAAGCKESCPRCALAMRQMQLSSLERVVSSKVVEKHLQSDFLIGDFLTLADIVLVRRAAVAGDGIQADSIQRPGLLPPRRPACCIRLDGVPQGLPLASWIFLAFGKKLVN